jgi:GNAT superfamily N-acetyltransferase
MKLSFKPVTPDRWTDLEALFGENGACGGCWCMTWKTKRSEWEKYKGAGNKKRLKKLVSDGGVPGLLAYDGVRPVGWCAVEPRENYPVLARSRVLKPIDDQPVWSVTCLFISKNYRRQGVSAQLLKAAAAHVKKSGGRIIEGYPFEPKVNQPDAFVWTGIASAYLEAGFEEAARGSKTRPIMRKTLGR